MKFLCTSHDSKLNLMVQLQLWTFQGVEPFLCCFCSQTHSDPKSGNLSEYYNGTKETVVLLRPRCDLAVIKVDKR